MTALTQPGAPAIDLPVTDGGQPATPPAEPETLPPADRRRKVVLLLILLFLATALSLFALWYLFFRQPITEVLPILDLTNPPAFQSATYGLDKPLGIAVTDDGTRRIVTQGGVDRSTLMLDEAGNKVAVLAPPELVATSVDQLYVAINPQNGNIYATDRTAGAVYIYAADGSYQGRFEPTPSPAGWQPLGIAFDAGGNLYIADVGAATARVHVYGPDGALLRDIGVADGLSYPNGLGVDAAGNTYVADSNNGRLIVYDPTGARLGLVARGSGEGQLGLPRGVAVDGHGRVYVVDKVGQVVQMYGALAAGEQSPTYLASFGREGTVDGAFEFPNGVAVDTRGHVYVTDWNNDRIQTWSY